MLQPAAQLPVTEMHFKDRVCASQYVHLRTLPLYKFDNSYDRQSPGVWTVTFMFFTLSSKAVLLHYHWQGKEGKKKKRKKKKHLLFSDHVFLHSTNSCHGFNSLYAPETLSTVI